MEATATKMVRAREHMRVNCTCLKVEGGAHFILSFAFLFVFSTPVSSSAKKKKKRKKRKKKIVNTNEMSPTATSAPAPIEEEIDPADQDKIDRLNEWLAKGAHLSRQKARTTTMLFDAASVGHVEATRQLLEKPGIRILKDVEMGGSVAKYTALHVAAMRGRAHFNVIIATFITILANIIIAIVITTRSRRRGRPSAKAPRGAGEQGRRHPSATCRLVGTIRRGARSSGASRH